MLRWWWHFLQRKAIIIIEYGKTAVFLKDALEMKKITYTRIAVWLWQAMAKYCSLRTKMIRRLNQKTLLGIDSNIGINSNILKYNYRCKILVNCTNLHRRPKSQKQEKPGGLWFPSARHRLPLTFVNKPGGIL